MGTTIEVDRFVRDPQAESHELHCKRSHSDSTYVYNEHPAKKIQKKEIDGCVTPELATTFSHIQIGQGPVPNEKASLSSAAEPPLIAGSTDELLQSWVLTGN